MHPSNRFSSRAEIGFALVTALVVAVVVASALVAERAAERRERVLAAYTDDLTSAWRAQVSAERMIATGRGYLLTREPDLLARVRTAELDLERALGTLESRTTSTLERGLVGEAKRSATSYLQLLDGALTAATTTNDQMAVATFVREQLLPARGDLEIRIQNLVTEKRRLRDAGRVALRRAGSRAFLAILGTGVAGALLAASLALISTRRLAQLYQDEKDAARRARQAAQTTEDLMGVVAHDLRNPLGAITATAALIEKGTDNPEIRNHASRLTKVASHMAHFIRSLLDAEAIESGGFSVVRQDCSVFDLVDGAIEMWREVADKKQILLRSRAEGASTVWVDPARIHQVLGNLLDNAIKFTPEAGAVELRVVDASPKTRFEVHDSGPGIPGSDLPNLFGRYWKGRTGGTRGVGLGLYIAKGIVDSHEGQIWVETTLGRGTTFVFEVPTLPPLGAAIRPPPLRAAAQPWPSQ